MGRSNVEPNVLLGFVLYDPFFAPPSARALSPAATEPASGLGPSGDDRWRLPRSACRAGREMPTRRRAIRRSVDRAHAVRQRGNLGVGAVPHGFRSSFRDWAAERTDAPHAVMEAALAHKVANRVEAADFRSDLLGRRRRLMQKWGQLPRPILTAVHLTVADFRFEPPAGLPRGPATRTPARSATARGGAVGIRQRDRQRAGLLPGACFPSGRYDTISPRGSTQSCGRRASEWEASNPFVAAELVSLDCRCG